MAVRHDPFTKIVAVQWRTDTDSGPSTDDPPPGEFGPDNPGGRWQQFLGGASFAAPGPGTWLWNWFVVAAPLNFKNTVGLDEAHIYAYDTFQAGIPPVPWIGAVYLVGHKWVPDRNGSPTPTIPLPADPSPPPGSTPMG